MITHPDRYAQMQSKLQEGLQILSQTSDKDSYQLGMALLKLHAALEDQFRIEIAKKAPSLRIEVEDPKKTSWNELIRYGKQYLRLSESDVRIIVEANRQRQSVAHGGNYERGRGDLVRYADFVERWCDARGSATYEFRPRTAPRISKPAAFPSTETRGSAPKSWYRSTLFLSLLFFLVPPLWSLSILTDRYRGFLLKLFAGAWLAVQVCVGALMLDPSSMLLHDSLRWLDERWNAPLPLVTATVTAEATPSLTASPALATVTAFSSTQAACTLVWVEYPSDALAGKNRSMVWAEVVMPRINSSGMTARQFYDLVLEQNPQLVRDGYEFKKGKTYLLPDCE
jgi:hypothetical protein